MLLDMMDNTMIRDNFIMIDSISKAEPLARKINCLAKPLLFRSSATWDSGVSGKSISSWWELTLPGCHRTAHPNRLPAKTEAFFHSEGVLGLGMSIMIESQNGFAWKGHKGHLIPTPLPWQGDVYKCTFTLVTHKTWTESFYN